MTALAVYFISFTECSGIADRKVRNVRGEVTLQ